MKILTNVIDLIDCIFPENCVICGKEISKHKYICKRCESDIEPITGNTCSRCGAPVKVENLNTLFCENCSAFNYSFIRNKSIFIYSKAVKRLIHSYKYKRRWGLYRLLSQYIIEKGNYIRYYDAITEVPLNTRRYRDRGFNQSYLIAREISLTIKVDFYGMLLKRKGRSRPQSKAKTLYERYSNMNDNFFILKKDVKRVKNKRILLIDDVLTTGITASKCADVLYNAGAKEVSLLTIARAVRF